MNHYSIMEYILHHIVHHLFSSLSNEVAALGETVPRAGASIMLHVLCHYVQTVPRAGASIMLHVLCHCAVLSRPVYMGGFAHIVLNLFNRRRTQFRKLDIS